MSDVSTLDGSQIDVKDSAMIALLPINSDWCTLDLPHLTLVYCGLLSDLQPTEFNEMAKDAASIAMMSGVITLKVLGPEVFGDTEKVDVLRLQPSPELMAMRRVVDNWNASQFPFSPHVTIGSSGSFTPNPGTPMDVSFPPLYIAFDRICVCWGEDQLTFWLKR